MKTRRMKAISPLISAVMLIVITFAISAIVSPWMTDLTRDVANETSDTVTRQISCQSTAYDFDTSFASNGINASTTGTANKIDAKIVNTGTVNLYGFSIEIEIDSNTTGLQITQLAINDTYQKTAAQPLKPGQGAILKANISGSISGTLREVKILNSVCPDKFVAQRL